MSIEKTKLKKSIGSILILAFLLPSVLGLANPKIAEAVPVSDVGNTAVSSVNAGSSAVNAATNSQSLVQQLKDAAKEIGKQVLMRVAQKVLQELTKSTVNWINTGRWGNPLFLDNPKSFFEDIAKSEIKNIVAAIGYDGLRFPFGRDYALSIIASYKRQFEDNASYTLSRAIQDEQFLQSYRNNFALGGWNGFLLNTQYPQNNYLGFQLMATQQLASKLEGTAINEATKVQNTLQQGMGFLSPLTCPSNPNYPIMTNPYKPPVFEFDKSSFPSYEEWEGYNEELDDENNYAQWASEYRATEANARAAWNDKYKCPKGLVQTTPGSVLADVAMKAVGTGREQGILAASLGNSLSAVFDAMFNKLLDKGFKALATKSNPTPEEDNWSYEGQTLGTAVSRNGDDWSTWPDEIISLSEIRRVVEEGIVNTSRELNIISNDTSSGILDIYNQTWPKIRAIDVCLPGPDLGWEERVDEEARRNTIKLQEKVGSDEAKKAADAQQVVSELNLALSYFKDWIKNKMLTALPGSVLYIDEVDRLDTIFNTTRGLVDKRRVKTQTLARLQSIQSALGDITEEPEAGTDEEKILIELKKQYNSVRDGIGNQISVNNIESELKIAQEDYKRTSELLERCITERSAAGWTGPLGSTGILSGGSKLQDLIGTTSGSSLGTLFGGLSGVNPQSEQGLFCNRPIQGGNSHWMFINNGRITHPEILLVNAKKVYTESKNWNTQVTTSVAAGAGIGAIVGNVIPIPGVGAGIGAAVGAGVGWVVGFFRSGTNIDIQLSCNIIYRASELDYKGNIPGLSTGLNPYAHIQPPIEFPPPSEGGECSGVGQYAGVLMEAMQQVLDERSDIAALDPRVNTAPTGGREYRGNAIEFLRLTAEKLGSMGYEATHEVLNGNAQPSTGDIIAVWRSGDTAMERYDAINGSASTMRDAPITDFTGLIPLDCTLGGGGAECACQSDDNTVPIETGGGNQCSFASGTHGNDPGAPLEIDPNTVIFDQGDNVKNWAQTATLSGVSVNGDTINLPYDKASSWPSSMLDTAATVGNPWIIVWRNGAWHAVTFSWLRPGQTSKTVDDVFFGGIGGAQTFGDFKPVAGERYGFMVSGVARDMSINNIRERSNIVTYTWPSGINASCAVGGGSGTTPVPTNPGTTGGPTISSVSPTTISAGTTISIRGTNLTSTIQFFDGTGGRHTVLGSLSGGGSATQVDAVAPSGMASGQGSVRVYKNASSFSNSLSINIGGGGPGNIPFATPSKTIVPTGIDVVGYLDRTYQNGWWPSISPNGRYVAFGNWGDSFVLDLESTSTTPQWNFEKPDGLPDNANCLAGQWLSNTKLTFVCEIGASGQGGFYRYEVTVGEWVAKKTNDDPQLVRATQFRAKDNHWASYLVANGQTRIVRDGQIVSSNNPGGAISIAGTTLVHACTNDNQSICVRNSSTLVKTHQVQGELHLMSTDGSHIIYGGYGGGVRGITPTGATTNMTLSPSGFEGPSEIVNVNGTRWVVSMAWGNDYTYILLRPWGSRSAIVVNAPAVHVSTVYKNGNFIIAYNDDVGNIKILTVPITAQRHQF